MGKTKIEWTEYTWSPVTGCTPVSEGCKNCYARRFALRLRGRCGYPEDEPFRVTLHPERLEEPLRWRKPRRVFVVSMGDLFHDQVGDVFIDRVWTTMALAVRHIFIVLTKRPERMQAYLMGDRPVFRRIGFNQFGEPINWPLSNVWLGVSAENQKAADERIPILLQTPAAKRFVSCEPLLSHIHLRPSAKFHIDTTPWLSRGRIDWVVCGGETGPGARPMHPDWVRSLRNQCQAAGVPFFMKQMSGRTPIPEELMVRELPE